MAAQARLRPTRSARATRAARSRSRNGARAEPLANALLGLGLAKGDRVALLAYNCVEWMELYVGLARAGLVAVPINFRLVSAEIEYIVRTARPVPSSCRTISSIASSRSATLGIVGGFIHFGTAPRRRAGRVRGADRARVVRDAGVAVAPEDTWALMYTSGTTGRPKGAIRNHAGSALISLVTALDMGFARDDTALLVMPMCHANSLYFSFTFTYLGATCVIDDRKSFDPEGLLRTMSPSRSRSPRSCPRTTS